jgi:hypothetical protein
MTTRTLNEVHVCSTNQRTQHNKYTSEVYYRTVCCSAKETIYTSMQPRAHKSSNAAVYYRVHCLAQHLSMLVDSHCTKCLCMLIYFLMLCCCCCPFHIAACAVVTKTGRTRKLSNKQVVSASGGARSLQWNDQPSAAGKLLYANFTHRSRQGMLRAAFFCCYDRHGILDMLRCVQKDSSNGRIRIMFVEQPPCSTLFGIAPAHFNCSVMV